MTAQNDKTLIAPPLDFHTDLPVGEILRRTRVHYGQSLDDVSNFLRIRVTQIEALEKGEIDKLPGRVYAIGYIRTYSEYLGLDGEKMIQLFKAQMVGKPGKPELYFPVAASESKAPNLYIIFGSLATLLLVAGVWVVLNIQGHDRGVNVTSVPNVPEDIRAIESPVVASPSAAVAGPPAPTVVVNESPDLPPVAADLVDPSLPVDSEETEVPEAPSAPEQAQENVQPSVQKREITINVKERSWVEVRDQQGKPILSRILTPGEVFIVPEQNYGLRLDTGNAGGLELIVNGQALPPLGHKGDILRGMILDGNKLLDQFKPSNSAQ